MALVIGCFVAGSLFIMAAALMDNDPEDEMADEREARMWINALADESKRGKKNPRRRYFRGGVKS